uniref:L-ornithine N5-acetyltransferase NATA1-like n=1 Tax=Nicotiana tabacum TaxID=4097 RepID=A0A1S4DCC8_TOBAC|nr:PREDICTED: L-ornithine N5-acetyltransferase NATA1-like [Nicotiana tabacum]
MEQEKTTTFSRQISARIRLVAEPDVPNLHKLVSQMANYHGLSHVFTTTETSLSNTLFKFPPFHSFTALILEISPNPFPSPDIYVAGHVLVFPSYNGFFEKPGLYLDQMFVRKCYRGMRLGKLLFSAVALQDAKMGMGMVDWLVADWNEESIHLYEKMGAHCIPEYRLCKLYGENCFNTMPTSLLNFNC